LVVFFSTLLFC